MGVVSGGTPPHRPSSSLPLTGMSFSHANRSPPAGEASQRERSRGGERGGAAGRARRRGGVEGMSGDSQLSADGEGERKEGGVSSGG